MDTGKEETKGKDPSTDEDIMQYLEFLRVEYFAYTLKSITGSEVFRAPVISWLNRNGATHSNPHILRVVLSVWSNAEGVTLEALVMCFWRRFCDQQTVRA